MGLKHVVKPLDDVFDESLDTAIAPSLGKVYGYATGAFKPETQVEAVTLSLYGDPDRFFSATYITEGMRKVFEES
jgi:predicted AAA+ superfamily ATPase